VCNGHTHPDDGILRLYRGVDHFNAVKIKQVHTAQLVKSRLRLKTDDVDLWVALFLKKYLFSH
jgi:hypothetical protein